MMLMKFTRELLVNFILRHQLDLPGQILLMDHLKIPDGEPEMAGLLARFPRNGLIIKGYIIMKEM